MRILMNLPKWGAFVLFLGPGFRVGTHYMGDESLYDCAVTITPPGLAVEASTVFMGSADECAAVVCGIGRGQITEIDQHGTMRKEQDDETN